MNAPSAVIDEDDARRGEALKGAVISLQSCLQKIVENQKKVLQDNEEYQKKFYKLCNDIGVDPFTQKKGFLAGLLNTNLDSFYKNLGMRVLTVCLNTRYENGGLIKLSEVKERLNQPSIVKKMGKVHSDDIRIAVQKLSCLSSSITIEKVMDEGEMVEYIKSADMDFSADSLRILAKANRRKGKIQVADMDPERSEKWKKELDLFVTEGLAWIDVHEGVTTYYFPTMVFASS